LSAGAVVAAAAAVEAEEEEARTADAVAHGARGAPEAGETAGAARQMAPARSPATREAGELSYPQANSAAAAQSRCNLSGPRQLNGRSPRGPQGMLHPELGSGLAAKSGYTASSAQAAYCPAGLGPPPVDA